MDVQHLAKVLGKVLALDSRMPIGSAFLVFIRQYQQLLLPWNHYRFRALWKIGHVELYMGSHQLQYPDNT